MCEHSLKLYFNRALPIDWNINGQSTQYTKAKWKSKPYYYSVSVPCGYCLECRLAKAKDWATRCVCEARLWAKNCFVTFTYNDDNLPLTEDGRMTLKKKDMQDFFKRLLKNQKCDKYNTIRRFYCGEYGPKRGRPHYHAIIFNYCPDDLVFYKKGKNGDDVYKSKSLQKLWGKGFVTVGMVTAKSAGYVARYTLKKAGIKPRKKYKIPNRLYHPVHNPKVKKFITILEKKDGIESEFTVSSRRMGIGFAYWQENKIKIKRAEGIYIKEDNNIKLNAIPKYFEKLWEKEDWENYHRYKFKKEKQAEQRLKEELALHPGMTEEELKAQKAKSLKIRVGALRRQETFTDGINLKEYS